MTKLWKPKGLKSEKLILIEDGKLYKGELSQADLNNLQSESRRKETIAKLFGVPFSYMKRIVYQEKWTTFKLISVVTQKNHSG